MFCHGWTKEIVSAALHLDRRESRVACSAIDPQSRGADGNGEDIWTHFKS